MALQAVEPKGEVSVVWVEPHCGQGTVSRCRAWRENFSTLVPAFALLPHCGGAMP